jgi:hypothetical protein
VLVGVIDESAKLVVGLRRIVRESRLGRQEVMDAVAVVGADVELQVLQNGCEPAVVPGAPRA